MAIISYILMPIIFSFYAVKKGIDFYFLAAASTLIFFYPIIFFDEIYFIADGIRSVPVHYGARLSIDLGILFLLFYGIKTKVLLRYGGKLSINLQHKKKFCIGAYDFLGVFVGLCLLVLMFLIVRDNGFGLQGRSKSELMENLGYLYKTYTILLAIVISFAFLTKRKWQMCLAGVGVFFDVMFGFRVGLGFFIAIYFLTKPVRPGWLNIHQVILGVITIFIVITIKESAYFSKNVLDVLWVFFEAAGDSGVSMISTINSESSSISVVYNEIVRNGFDVTLGYLGDVIVSTIPFTNLIGYEAIPFDTYFKGAVFGAEGDSFASGMLAIGFSLGGYFGVAAQFIFIALLGRIYFHFRTNGDVLSNVFMLSFAAVVLVLFFRSDFIYFLGIIRGLILLTLALYLALHVLRNCNISASKENAVVKNF